MTRLDHLNRTVLVAALALGTWLVSGTSAAQSARVWEVNGIRLEADQVERLADDIAERTVRAVEAKVADLALTEAQRPSLREIYRSVALDVYGQVVDEVARDDRSDAQKQDRVRELVLEGQQRSHARAARVLDARQLELYSAWEDEQVEAFKSRRWERRRRRR